VTAAGARPTVLHLDADAFFASVEQLDDPRLAGRAVLVGGLGNRAVVASASREAKARGARSAMPMEQARRMVGPHVVVTPRGDRYREVSRALFELVREHAGDIEQVSIDEAFLHVPAVAPPARFAVGLVRAVRRSLGLTVSIGGGTTRLVAKLASTRTKREAGPGTVLVVPAEDERDWLAPMDVGAIPGVGPRTREALEAIGVGTVADARTVGLPLLRRQLGEAAAVRLVALADNAGPWELELDREAKQTSHETTYETDRTAPGEIADEVRRLAAATVDDLGPRVARTVTVKLRDTDFTTVTRSDTAAATADLEALTDRALWLAELAHEAVGRRPVRLIGVALSNFSPHAQLALDLVGEDAPGSGAPQGGA
jgi:DNA polymerase-4